MGENLPQPFSPEAMMPSGLTGATHLLLVAATYRAQGAPFRRARTRLPCSCRSHTAGSESGRSVPAGAVNFAVPGPPLHR
jgi:hypothetical protein